ncbi:Protein LONGIFOLIA 1 [Camellia lanceoleosa]|uniref:Protein LONGIFOLIA 1 n=1 Tax=Camellia lanceoleosa TaxID=1840588 RepID=A0ACC0IYG8_9ERIC|nr:Protein LONGIFOLIA 1 [Camellia lanceoleosa]
MGKEWLYRGGGSGRSTKGGRLGGGGGERETASGSGSGCMSAVFQLFDFHQFQFALHQQVPPFKPDVDSFLPEEPTLLKGVEAPRNSLEMDQDEHFREVASFPSTMKEEETLNIPMGIQIKTSVVGLKVGAPKARTDDLSSETSSPPEAKTPNLVARLMGLDLLPDSCSPSSSSSNHSTSKLHPLPHPQLQNLKQEIRHHRHLSQSRSTGNKSFFDTDVIGSRSLPETPRISSARRSDVDHRLSLQISKENIVGGEEFEFSGYLATKMSRRREIRQEDDGKSPGHYARQIAKQVKESVSRKVGMEITNTIRNRDESSPSKHQQSTTPSCSPRVRFLEVKNKNHQLVQSPKLSASPLSSSVDNTQTQLKSGKVSSKPPKPQAPMQEQKQQQQQQLNSSQKCKKIESERYGSRLKKLPQTSDVFRNKQEELFVRSSATNRVNHSEKKCKKTPLSSELLNINVPSSLFPVKKDTSSSTTKLPQKQGQVSDAVSSKSSTQLSSCCSQPYIKHKHKHKQQQQPSHPQTLTVQNSYFYYHTTTNAGGTAGGGGAQFQYITQILKCSGIHLNTPLSSFTPYCYSPSHPLHPSIFHHLELSFLTATVTATATATATAIEDSQQQQQQQQQLSHRCNRKLVFELIDELLVPILKPHINLKPWLSPAASSFQYDMCGSQLIDTLCSKIQSFPLADCRVLEDIDALIDLDLCGSQQLRGLVEFEEEGEEIVAEVEREIVETLVHEMAEEVALGRW